MVVRGFLSFLIDALAPLLCVHCGTEIFENPSPREMPVAGGWTPEILTPFDRSRGILCVDCLSRLDPADLGSERGEGEERGGSGIVTPFFTNDVLLSLVRFFKFEGGVAAADPLARWMALALRGRLPGAPALVTSVPLHVRRLRRRGYDQAALLAARTAGELGLPFDDRILIRWRHTRSQARLEEEARERNVRGAFRLSSAGSVRGRHILLVDDLVTSGGTMRACIETLLQDNPAGVTAVAAGRRKALSYLALKGQPKDPAGFGSSMEGAGGGRPGKIGSP